MNSLIDWFARNHIAANMLMFLVMILGGFAVWMMPKEIIPDISLDTISVSAFYPGASPRDVEEAVCIRIENAVAGLSGVGKLTSIAQEQGCGVQIELAYGANTRDVLDKIKSRVDAISNFPDGVTRPIVQEFNIPKPVASLVVYGNTDYKALRSVAEHIRDDLSDMGLSQVTLPDVKPFEISIEVPSLELERYGLSFSEVQQAIKRNAVKYSGGAISTGTGNIAVSAVGLNTGVDDLRHVVLKALPDGSQITLGDIATINDGFRETNAVTLFNGMPAISIGVAQEQGMGITEVSELVHKYLDKPKPYIPESVKLTVEQDTSEYFSAYLNLLSVNALQGLAMVFITLMLFLDLRTSWYVTLGLPTSLAAGMVVLFLCGGSINMISIFGVDLVLGIVEDAIVVSENVHRHQVDLKRKGIDGVIGAVQEIALPLFLAVMVMVIAFCPLLFLPGADGQLIKPLAIIVIAVLLAGKFEALLILPGHLVKPIKPPNPKNPIVRIQRFFDNGLQVCIDKYYQPLLKWTLAWRYAAVVGFIMIMFISFALISGGWVKAHLVTEISGDFAVANVSFPRGTSIDVTKAAVARIEKAGIELKVELAKEYKQEQIRHVRTVVGFEGDHEGRVLMPLTSSRTRIMSGEAILERWRAKVGEISGASTLDYAASINRPGPEFDVMLSSANPQRLEAASKALREHLEKYPAVYGVRDSLQGGKREVQLRMKPSAYGMGIDLPILSAQVMQAFQGVEVQNLTREKEEVKVILRYPKNERDSLWHLENMNIRLLDGTSVPLSAVADVFYGVGPSSVLRHNRKRVVEVTARIDQGVSSTMVLTRNVTNDFLSKLEDDFPGVKWQPAGVSEQTGELMERLLIGFFIAIAVMFMLMAVLYRSYYHPFMVMTAVPFGLVGALIGHMIMGLDITMWSAAGMIAVSGVVLNDNMVMVFYVNDRRAAGETLEKAITEVGPVRFRPIMLTTLTIIAGMSPMMTEPSWMATFLVPMAVSISFGVGFATLVSLLLVPALYLVLDDIAQLWTHRNKPKFDEIDQDDDNVRYDDDGIVH